MSNYILFGPYLLLLLGIFGFLAVFMMHIRDYRQYSRYITITIRVYLTLMIIIALFGGYMILSGTVFPQTQSPVQQINL